MRNDILVLLQPYSVVPKRVVENPCKGLYVDPRGDPTTSPYRDPLRVRAEPSMPL